MATETELREKLSACTRIFAMQELLGLFGHISAYDPDAQHVYFSPSQGVDKTAVKPDDILVSDLDGTVLEGDRRLPAEWPIHTVLHNRRMDALAVAHLHAPYATLFAIARREFQPITLQGSVFGGGLPVYSEPALIRSVAQGKNLAKTIGDRPAAFLRGHGIVVVARDVEQMLYASLILEDEARKWVQASTLGEVQPLSHEDCRTFGAKAEFPGRAQRCWHYFTTLEKRWDRQPGTGCVPFV
ncbi:MAG: class II aldolase/adducin family protein [Gemmatimonas sp.]